MKSLPPLSPRERDRSLTVLGTGQYVRYTLNQVQQFKEICFDLKLSSNGRSRRSVFRIPDRSNDRQPMVLDPGKNRGVAQFHVEQHDGLNREAGHVVLDKARCLCDYMSGIMRIWSEHLNLDLYRCSITNMVDHSICVVAVEGDFHIDHEVREIFTMIPEASLSFNNITHILKPTARQMEIRNYNFDNCLLSSLTKEHAKKFSIWERYALNNSRMAFLHRSHDKLASIDIQAAARSRHCSLNTGRPGLSAQVSSGVVKG